MRFIFPKNYNFNPKLFGLIEYSTAIMDIVIAIILYFVLNLLITDISLKLSLFIVIFMPILLISILGINKESFITVLRYLIKYFRKPKIYLYYR